MSGFELLVPKLQADTLLARPRHFFEVKIVKSSGITSTRPLATYEDQYVTLTMKDSLINVTPKGPLKTVSVTKQDDVVYEDKHYIRFQGSLHAVSTPSIITYDTILRTPESVLFVMFPKDADTTPIVSQTSTTPLLPIFMNYYK
jgi:hypothetical protein